MVCHALESGIKSGQISVHDGSETYVFGQEKQKDNTRRVSIYIRSEAFWVRVYLRYDLGCKCILHYLLKR